jgi:hypothetical protein
VDLAVILAVVDLVATVGATVELGDGRGDNGRRRRMGERWQRGAGGG